MPEADLMKSVTDALRGVAHPSTGRNLLDGGQVQNIEIDEIGNVRFGFQLGADDSGDLVKAARSAVDQLGGVASVKINLQLPQQVPERASSPAGGQRGTGGLQPGSVPAPTPKPGLLSEVDHVIAVSSGKGGVGKSMVATNLAVSLAQEGLRVGLIDADIYGPNIPRMFGESRRPRVTGEKGSEMIEPLQAHGVRLMSLGFLLEEEQPAIMRGPLISGILKQFLQQVDWGPLDLMVVDMPPGTGDAQLSLVQTVDVDGAIMVTTPQAVAVGDVRRAVKMFERVNTRVLGIVENMGAMLCPGCNETIDVFGEGGGKRLAIEMGLPFLGSVPLDPAVRRSGDAGTPIVKSEPDSPAAKALVQVAEQALRAVRVSVGAE